MLWDLIYEFFVKYIFGGYLWGGSESEPIDAYWVYFGNNPTTAEPIYTCKVPVNIFGLTTSFGNYLSMIATIITLVIILLVIGHFIKKTFNLFGRII